MESLFNINEINDNTGSKNTKYKAQNIIKSQWNNNIDESIPLFLNSIIFLNSFTNQSLDIILLFH
jgi:hypothetical protein